MFKISSSHEAPKYNSGLYHFITSNYVHNTYLQRFTLENKKKNSREVWFISLPLGEEKEYFPDSRLECTDKHLSIDRYILDGTKTPLDYFFYLCSRYF